MLFFHILFFTCVTIASAKRTRTWYLMPDDGGHGIHLVNMLRRARQNDVPSIESNVTLYLYTRNNDTSVIDCDNIGGFDSKWPTVMLAHGWMSKSSDLDHIKNAYLTAGDYNVISIDWSPIASNAAYDQVREDLVIVGQFVAKFVDCLVETHGLNLSITHLVGHSLGAHVVGVIGGSLSQQNKVALITGLDPAGPGYDDNENPENEKMLDQEDAEFVQVIHTNAGVLGYKYTLGDADFFPNGGSEQPGCDTDDYGACSHGRSTLYFAESVTSASAFIGYQCDSWDTCTNCNGKPSAVMGAHVDPSTTTGVYYLSTASSSPYGLGVQGCPQVM
ncbi:phospholipase A1-like [Schistocerca cancellata]|uniref:phospholipase A1-like n=1 Tax=Schistocerca cancellata TaxID=274614 RepID=UPI0021181CA5|nr:phospholipase A1-like [Schistocerca cancellata]